MTREEATARMIEERESGSTMSEIAAKLTRLGYPCTRNMVVGTINRRAPELVVPATVRPHPTLFDRCQVLHDRMDRFLAEMAEDKSVKPEATTSK